jgi:hypothetical protein
VIRLFLGRGPLLVLRLQLSPLSHNIAYQAPHLPANQPCLPLSAHGGNPLNAANFSLVL